MIDPSSPDLLDNLLKMINGSVLSSNSRLVTVAQALVTTLLVLDMTLLGIKTLLGLTDVMEDFKQKLLHYIFWAAAFIVLTNPAVLKAIEDTAVEVGRNMANGLVTDRPAGYITGPSQIMAVGVDSVGEVLAQLTKPQPVNWDLTTNVMTTVYTFLVAIVSTILIMAAFGALAITYIMAFVECSVVLGFGGIFVALAFFEYTDEFAERYLSTMAGYVMKLTLVVFLAQISYPMMVSGIHRFDPFTLDGLMGLMLMIGFFSVLINVVPQVPNDITMGTVTTPGLKQLIMNIAGVQFARFIYDQVRQAAVSHAMKKAESAKQGGDTREGGK